jgi:carbonic anhydrase
MQIRDSFPAHDTETCGCFACSPPADVSRRGFLRAGAVATAAGLLASAGAGLVLPRRALAQSAIGPDKALAMLMEGNGRYVAQKLTSFDDDLAILKQNTAEKQQPFAAVLSCADSRVPVELVFDQTIGHVFVTRVAGNVATNEMIGSLEYGVAVLGAEVVMVMGHASCGAIVATIAGKEVPGQISGLYPYMRPAVDQAGAGADANTVVRVNAQIQARLLKEASPVLADFVKQGKLKVVASYYDLATGKVALLD